MKSLLITTIAIFGLNFISYAQLPNYVPSNGIVGYWPFNGDANDASSNEINGVNNGAILTTDRFGNNNSSFDFQGSQWIEFNYNPILNVGSNSFSISCWATKSGANQFQHLVTRNQISSWPDAIGSYALRYEASAITFFGSSDANNSNGVVSTASVPNLNSWNHLVGIYDSQNNVISIYINGILSISEPINPNAQSYNNNGGLFFGVEHPTVSLPSGPNFLTGKLDDIGIWNRALTQQEISNLYNATNCSNDLSISQALNQIQIGNTATFSATISDANPIYAWQSDFGQGFQTLNDYGNYSGVNTNTLSISNVQLSEHNQPIRVISTSGECIDTSNVATISITDTCIVTVNDTITTLISVTDTLVINTLITGLTPPNNSNTIKIFPNPANNHITIDFGNFESMNGYTLTITNSIGQTVYTTPINEQSSYIDLSTWSGNGIYFVQIIDSQNNIIENRKIILQ